MFVAYVAYLFFQLKTHRRLFEAQEVDLLAEPIDLSWLILV